MIGRTPWRSEDVPEAEARSGFDAFDLRLGDLMRGERATLGKSLLDVQRELKIKAAYIAAIENADPSAFETPGFIAGYVRSYARYLGMDPEWAFDTFCAESGFETAHGMSPAASSAKKPKPEETRRLGGDDMFSSPTTPFVPTGEGLFSRVEPGAVGSVLVLVALIGGLGYGGWTVLQEVQRVQFAPVDQAPTVVADVDPLAGGAALSTPGGAAVSATATGPAPEALDRLYRPQALDLPVMVARDAPISTLSPTAVGALAMDLDTTPAPLPPFGVAPPATTDEAVDLAVAAALGAVEGAVAPLDGSAVQVTQAPVPAVELVAVRPAWVRVTGADGSTLYERIMEAGDTYVVPQTEEPATLRIGESGAVYFAVNGQHYGPVGPRGSVTSNVALSSEALRERYEVANIEADDDLREWVRVAQARQVETVPAEGEAASE